MKRIVVGLDPGTGVSSPTGFAAFDPDSRELLHAQKIVSAHKKLEHRIKDIAQQVSDGLLSIDPDAKVYVFCEAFVMRGKAGENLARLTGALMSAVPYEHHFDFVYNTTVKKIVGGTGKADKLQVAQGVHNWVSVTSVRWGRTLTEVSYFIERGEWDITDAFAIGIAGWERLNANEHSN